MWLPDTNILIYAFRPAAAQHASCLEWLQTALANQRSVLLCDVTELALLRVSTQLPAPTPLFSEVWEFLLSVRSAPAYRRVMAGSKHGEFLKQLVRNTGRSGRHLTDLWLAALAMEHGATLVSADKGFSTFPKLAWMDPTTKI